jgi:hypothetical protein
MKIFVCSSSLVGLLKLILRLPHESVKELCEWVRPGASQDIEYARERVVEGSLDDIVGVVVKRGLFS